MSHRFIPVLVLAISFALAACGPGRLPEQVLGVAGIRGGIQFSGFNHENNNDLAQSIQAARGYDSPTGSAWHGNLFNVNLALGGKFADGRGHGTLYLDYRDASALLKSARDYTNCSVTTFSSAGPRCGGSGTTDLGTFYVYDPDDNLYGQYKLSPDTGNTWVNRDGYVWNFAPYNYLQRPDTRWVAGGFLNYDFNASAEGYLEVMYMNDRTDAQIAPSGGRTAQLAASHNLSAGFAAQAKAFPIGPISARWSSPQGSR